jgi:DNA-binding transcriptional LysR family regulator
MGRGDMTILQLKYVIEIANSSSLREAASKMYVSQPALSAAIRELEDELKIQIFDRTNKGVELTAQGKEFLSYAKQAVSQYSIIEDRYIARNENRLFFSVSMQHYVFALHAFIHTISRFEPQKYSYSIQETKTDEVLNNVRNLKSEIGIIAYTRDKEKLMNKLLREYHLQFFPLLVRDTFAYMNRKHPLAGKTEVSLEELREYPCISFDQSSDSEYYLAEEALDGYDFPKIIKTNDRATSAELLACVNVNGFAIGTGILVDTVALKDDFVCIKMKEEDPLTIGYIIRKNHKLSEIGKVYIEELEKYREQEAE